MAHRDPKRERKKQARDARVAAFEAQFRRRRIARIAGVVAFLLVLAVLIGSSLANRNDDTPAAGDGREHEEEHDHAGDGDACPHADDVPEADAQQYDAPEDVLEEGVDYAAVIRTSCGDIEMDLLEEEAPENVNSFVFLAEEGFFDGLAFHRLERNFVIQAGDPNGQNGDPPDGPGYTLPDELPDRPSEYQFGVVAMANRGPNTAGSQFFIITHQPETEPVGLPKQYSIFGRVEPGSYGVIEQIDVQKTRGGTDPVEAAKPVEPIYILGIDVVER